MAVGQVTLLRAAAAGWAAVAASLVLLAAFAAAVNANILLIALPLAIAAAVLAAVLWRNPHRAVVWVSTMAAAALAILIALSLLSSHPDFRGSLALPLVVAMLTAAASGIALIRLEGVSRSD